MKANKRRDTFKTSQRKISSQHEITDKTNVHQNDLMKKDEANENATDSEGFTITFYIENGTQCSNVSDLILEELQKIDLFTVTNCVEEENVIIPYMSLTDTSKLAVVVANVSYSQGFSPYRNFCSRFPFKIHGEDTHNVWTLKRVSFDRTVKEITSIQSKSYGFGILENVNQLKYLQTDNESTLIEFIPQDCINIIRKCAPDEGEFNTIRVSLTSLKNFAFLCYRKDQIILTLLLNHAPMFYRTKQQDDRKMLQERIYNAQEVQEISACSVLTISFNMKQENELKKILNSKYLFPITLLYTKIHFLNIKSETKSEINLDKCHKNIAWLIRCLHDARSVLLTWKDIEFAKTIDLNHYNSLSLLVLRLMQSNIPYLTNFKEAFNDLIESYQHNTIKSIKLDKSHEDNFVVKRIVITPTRCIAKPEYNMPSSRLLRFAKQENIELVIASFREENYSKVKDKTAINRYYDIFLNGFTVNGYRYLYLLSSASQLRNNKGYFVQTDSSEFVQSLRRKFVPNEEAFTTVAKYLSRLGTYATADQVVCKIKEHEIEWSDDSKALNGDLTTDGAGLVSFKKAKQISNILQLDETPSAFQIRYSGIKGIVVCTSDDDPILNGKEILIRNSMKKFDNDDEDFCMTSYSKYDKLSLNREIITLLSCIQNFNIETKLIEYLKYEMDNLIELFKDSNKGKRDIQNYISLEVHNLICQSEFNILNDRFWMKMLQAVYRIKSKYLKSKANLIIKKGCCLMGVPDTQGVLSENEIFIQLKDESFKTKVIESDAIIFRNPCLHPGDFRKVKCVNKPELHHLSNVVVFPTLNCKRSLSSACSGGDLDGDKYSVIWDEDLIPSCDYKPYDYKKSNVTSNSNNNKDISSKSIIAQYLCDFMNNDMLGKISTWHLALCDILEAGARDMLSVQLAIAHSKAVDFPKTGILPAIPEAAKNTLVEYPDFMEKQSEFFYTSKKVLGKMYRFCKSVFYNANTWISNGTALKSSQIDSYFESVGGHMEYIDSAKSLYQHYKHQMEELIYRFDLKDETDVILGEATYGWNSDLESSKSKISESLKSAYEEIVVNFREVFFADSLCETGMKRKALACYYVAYKLVNPNKALLSFPWMFGDILSQSFASVIQQPQVVYPNLQLGKTIQNFYVSKRIEFLEDINEKFTIRDTINHQFHTYVSKNFELSESSYNIDMYGSTSIYLNEFDSDVDLCINVKPQLLRKIGEIEKDDQRDCLRKLVSPSLDAIALNKKEVLHQNLNTPFVKFDFENMERNFNCDVTVNNMNGLLKTHCIQFLYKENPSNYLVFLVLVQWARRAEIIKQGTTDDTKTMDTAEFYGLIMHLLEFKDIVQPKNEEEICRGNVKELDDAIQNLSDYQIDYAAKTIIKFFEMSMNHTGEIRIKWPIKGIIDVSVSKITMDFISICSAKAYHCLLCTNNVEELFYYFLSTNTEITEFVQNLGNAIGRIIGGCRRYFANRLSLASGAHVHLSLNKKVELIVSAECTPESRYLLKEQVNFYKNIRRKLAEGQAHQLKGKYFLSGSSFILMPPLRKEDTQVHFMDNKGPFHISHTLTRRQRLIIKGIPSQSILYWPKSCKDEFHNRIKEQMTKFPLENKTLLKEIEITIRFGNFYGIKVPMRLFGGGISLSDLNVFLEKGKVQRPKWNRRDFDSKTLGRKVDKKDKPKPAIHISGSFIPNLLKENLNDAENLQTVRAIYKEALTKLAFHKGSAFDRDWSVWKVKVVASSSYELDIHLDKRGKMKYSEERPLNWVHATFVKGKREFFVNNVLGNVDSRVSIATNGKVYRRSDIYQTVLLKDGKVVLPIKIVDDKPIANEMSNYKKKILSVRHTKNVEMYTNGIVNAAIKSGIMYLLKDIASEQEFCEFSIYVNPKELQNCFNGTLDCDKLRIFTDHLFETTDKMQSTLEKIILHSSNDTKQIENERTLNANINGQQLPPRRQRRTISNSKIDAVKMNTKNS